MDGDQGIVVSDTDSDTAVTEDDRFRLSVPPVARAMKLLINDLNEASYKLKHNRIRKLSRPNKVDVNAMGLRFAFHEGLGFIEYFDSENPNELSMTYVPESLLNH